MSIEHDTARHCFYQRCGEYEAVLMYARRDRVIDLYHIYVPDPCRNRGLAGYLLAAAFDFARAETLKVIPTCPFIRNDFLPRFPQYHDIVDFDAQPFPFRGI
ncbi:MAG: N-acetyltransferase [Planctomycetes bacterium]|nr:N-acetyltransferase [Planctomycetota bacterium]